VAAQLAPSQEGLSSVSKKYTRRNYVKCKSTRVRENSEESLSGFKFPTETLFRMLLIKEEQWTCLQNNGHVYRRETKRQHRVLTQDKPQPENLSHKPLMCIAQEQKYQNTLAKPTTK
jgi:hypothetical protein